MDVLVQILLFFAVGIGSAAIGTHAVFLVPLWGPRLVFRGFVEPSQSIASPARFQLVDLVCLMCYVAPGNAFVTIYRWDFGIGILFLMMSLVSGYTATLWWLSVRFANRFHVVSSGRRLIIHLILFPASVFFPSLVISGCLFLIAGFSQFGLDTFFIVLLVDGIVMIGVGLWACQAVHDTFQHVIPSDSRESLSGEKDTTQQSTSSTRSCQL